MVAVRTRAARRHRRSRRSRRCSRRAAAPATGRSEPSAQSPRPAAGEWPFYSGTLDGHREQLKEKSIDTGNVSELGVAWQTTTPDGGVIHSTPVVADGCVFTGTDLGNVYALNADTGKVVWTRALGEGGEGSNFAEGAGIVGSPAVADGLVYVGATTPKASVLSALDQAHRQGRLEARGRRGRGRRPRLEPRALQGHDLPGLQGRRVERPLEARLRDRRRVAQGARQDPGQDPQHPGGGLRGRLPRRLDHQHAGRRPRSRSSSSPAPATRPARSSIRSPTRCSRSTPIPASPTFGKILASHRGTSDSYPAPAGRRLAHVPERRAVAGRPLLVRAVRLQLPGVAEPVDELRRAPDVRRPAEVGGVHRGLHRHHGAGVAGHDRAAVLRLQPQLDARSTRTGSTSP